VFKAGGAPVWYVRGDEWDLARTGRPAAELSRMVRLWPGGDRLMPRSEWSHEREWRVLGDLAFTPADIAFVIAPSLGWAATVASDVELYSEEWANYWRLVPEVALGADGAIIHDSSRLLA
jgi:hypothetical protein